MIDRRVASTGCVFEHDYCKQDILADLLDFLRQLA